jgi:two-component system, sensor histidine kinase and response regulator
LKTLQKPLILIVDNPTNLRKLGNLLRKRNYDVAVAQDGKSAIDITKSIKPDLVLLDLVMTDIDGFEVCETLVNDPETKDIPIIFLSSHSEPENIIQGLQLGAVDFIRRGDSEAELIARITTHLKLKRYTEQLENNNLQLLQLNSELERLNEEKDEFLGIAAHDLKNPINNIALIAKILLNDKVLTREDIIGFANDIAVSAERMLELIKNLLDINQIERGEIKLSKIPINLCDITKYVCNSFYEKAKAKEIILTCSIPEYEIVITTDNNSLIQILDNLISNAIKYSPYGKEIFISIEDNHHTVAICIEDQGPGFTDEDKEKVFGKFARLSAQPTAGENSTGLGLSIVQKLVDILGADIKLESEAGRYAKFIVRFRK